MKDELLEEARRRYPIGTKFKPAHVDETSTDWYTIQNQSFTGEGDPYIWSYGSENNIDEWQPVLYYDGKWAEVKDQVFPKDSYIVLLASCDGGNCWESIPVNYCYQLSRDSYQNHIGLSVYKCKSGGANGWSHDSKYNSKLKMRFATEAEVDHYKFLGKPYDVTAPLSVKAYDDWEPSEETCKKCANLYYNGHVNTGPHNLCEGSHCQDMKEEEYSDQKEDEPNQPYKIGDIVNTNDRGYQFCIITEEETYKNHPSGFYEKEEIVDIQFSPQNSKWWYMFRSGGNWYSEESIEPYYPGLDLTCNPTMEAVYNPILDGPLITGTGGDMKYTSEDILKAFINPEPTKLEVFIPKQKTETKSFNQIQLKTNIYYV